MHRIIMGLILSIGLAACGDQSQQSGKNGAIERSQAPPHGEQPADMTHNAVAPMHTAKERGVTLVTNESLKSRMSLGSSLPTSTLIDTKIEFKNPVDSHEVLTASDTKVQAIDPKADPGNQMDSISRQ